MLAVTARAWAKELGKELVRCLRHVHLQMPINGTEEDHLESYEDGAIELDVCVEQGLMVSVPGWVHDPEAVEERVAGIEEDRKMLGLRGEAMMLALTSLPKFQY